MSECTAHLCSSYSVYRETKLRRVGVPVVNSAEEKTLSRGLRSLYLGAALIRISVIFFVSLAAGVAAFS